MNNSLSKIDRRYFLGITGITSIGLIMGLSLKTNGETSVENLAGADDSFELTPFVIIEKTGQITLFNPRPEIGQGTFQSIPALIINQVAKPSVMVISRKRLLKLKSLKNPRLKTPKTLKYWGNAHQDQTCL
jgi:hypothetical protein